MDFLILALATLTAVIGNLSLKKGMIILGELNFTKDPLIGNLIKIFSQPFILFGLVFYVFSMFCWLKVLSIFEISKAYPILVAVSFTLVALGSYLLFKESLSPLKVLGMVVIFLGVLIVAKG